MRCFVAIGLPPEAREQIAAVQNAMRPAIERQGVRLLAPEKVHLTLEFLGQVSSADEAGLEAALREACTRHAPFTVEAGGLGAFPHDHRPAVLWVGVDATDALLALQADIARASEDYKERRDNREYRPHLTLARVAPPSQKVGHAFREFLERLPAPMPFAWPCAEVVLMETLPSGAYHRRASFPLIMEP